MGAGRFAVSSFRSALATLSRVPAARPREPLGSAAEDLALASWTDIRRDWRGDECQYQYDWVDPAAVDPPPKNIEKKTRILRGVGDRPRHGRGERHQEDVPVLRMLDDRELKGVLAHELAHIRDRDVLLMTFAATVAGAISYAAQIAFFSMFFGGSNNRSGVNPIVLVLALITAPIAAMLVQLAISRSREFRADEVGAGTLGDPEALASALQKLETANVRHPMTLGPRRQLSLFIVNPFRGASFAAIF